MDDTRLNNDAPITKRKQDRLGFRKLARHLADAFLRNDLSGGLVVGIEGEWGSGKSSLANLALRRLKKKGKKRGLRIVRFSPWIIGNREELLGQLFAELDSALSDLLPIKRRKQVRTALRKYAQASSLLAAPLKLAGDAGIPAAGMAGRAFDLTASTTSGLATPSLRKLNEELRADLISLKGRIVVFVDDIDRLEPTEAVEVLRLIRAVADFPNVGYLLAYDPNNLAKCLQKAIGVNDGKAYIEKIVQASFTIPAPANLVLRRLLEEELLSIIRDAIMSPEARDRLDRAVRRWCEEYISTPRDITRVLNSLSLYVAPVVQQVDMADALFVQIVRVRHPDLHNWIERHVQTLSGFDPDNFEEGWDRIDKDLFGVPDLRLCELLRERGSDLDALLRGLRAHLPLASIPDYVVDPRDFTFQDKQRYADEQRLWSPGYSRLYFALSTPANFVDDDEVFKFLETCVNQPEMAASEFRKLCHEDGPLNSKKSEALLARIYERRARLTLGHIRGLLLLLGNETDEFAREVLRRSGNPPWLYGDIMDVLRLIEQFHANEKKEVLREIFEKAASLTMLNGIFREAAVEHGSWGNITEPSAKKFLTSDEFQYVRNKLLERLRTADSVTIRHAPYFRNLMYGWCFAGGEEDAKAWVGSQISDDESFVDLLDDMKEVDSFGEYYYFAQETQYMFIESTESTRRRLEEISLNSSYTKGLRDKARALIPVVEHKPPR